MQIQLSDTFFTRDIILQCQKKKFVSILTRYENKAFPLSGPQQIQSLEKKISGEKRSVISVICLWPKHSFNEVE